MTKPQPKIRRAQTSIRCGAETFVFRYDLDIASLKTLGNAMVRMATQPDSQFNMIAAYRVMQHVDRLLREIDEDNEDNENKTNGKE